MEERRAADVGLRDGDDHSALRDRATTAAPVGACGEE